MTKVLYWLIFLCAALPAQDWKQSLTFHASFDQGLEADFALGDKRIYTAPDYKAQMEAKPGLDHPDVTVVAGGLTGSALRFGKKNVKAIFYQGDKNIAFRDQLAAINRARAWAAAELGVTMRQIGRASCRERV